MNTPALLGGFHLNEQEYFYGNLFGFSLANQGIYALLPYDPTKGEKYDGIRTVLKVVPTVVYGRNGHFYSYLRAIDTLGQ